MGNLTSTLTISLNEDLTKRAPAAAAALKSLGGAGKDLAKLGDVAPEVARLNKELDKLSGQAAKISAFREASKSLDGAGQAMRAARQEAGRLSAELEKARAASDALKGQKGKAEDRAAAAADVRRLTRELKAAEAEASATRSAFMDQGKAVRGMRNELAAAGVPLKELRTAEEGIRAAVAGVNAELARQPALIAAATAKAAALAKVTQDVQAAAQEAVRATRAQRQEQARVEAGRRASASGDMIRGMGAAGRDGVDRARVAERMSAPGRASRAARAELEREAAEERAENLRQRRMDRIEAAKALGAVGAVKAGHVTGQVARNAIEMAGDFDLAVRKQRVFTDINGDEQAGLLAQAKRIGQETQFSNIDVVKAQTAAMQGLPASFAPGLKAAVAEGIVQNVRNFSTLMETDLKAGTETIRSYLQATGKDISTKEKALAEANKAVNQIVKMAKLGGMDGEDASQLVKYAAASATTAGVTTETMMTLGALARRGGLRGDEAGVAMRSMASKIVSPTRDGIAALNAAGINYSDYVRMPKSLSTGSLENQFKTTMGKGFTPEIRKQLDAINANKDIIGDRAKYIEAVTKAVEPMLGRTKKGDVRASDAKVAAKAANAFYKVSGAGVDAEGLLDAAMSKNMTLAQLNAWLTDKHGGKGAITQRQWDEFRENREQIKKAGDDPDWARKKADEVYAGVGGSIENFKGSIANAILHIGNLNSGLIKSGADALGSGVDKFSQLPEPVGQGLSLGAMAGGALASVWGAIKLAKLALGLGGKTVAGPAAAALVGAEAGAAGGAVGAAAGGGAGGAAATTAAALAVPAAVAVGGAAASVIAAEAVKNKDFREPYLDGGMLAADPGGYGLGAAIMAAPELAQRMSEQNKRDQAAPATPVLPEWWRSRAPTWLGGDTAPAPASAPAGGGASEAAAKVDEAKGKVDALNATPIAPRIDGSGLDAFGLKVDEVKAKAGEVNALTIAPAVSTGNLGTLIQQLQTAIGLAAQLNAATAGLRMPGAGGVSSGRVRAAVDGNHSE